MFAGWVQLFAVVLVSLLRCTVLGKTEGAIFSSLTRDGMGFTWFSAVLILSGGLGSYKSVLARILWVARVNRLGVFAVLFCTFLARKRSVCPLAPPREMTDDMFRVLMGVGGMDGEGGSLLSSKQAMAACGCEKTWTPLVRM